MGSRILFILTIAFALTACGKIEIHLGKHLVPDVPSLPIPFSAGSGVSGGGAAHVTTALGNHASIAIGATVNTVRATSAFGSHVVFNGMRLE